MASAAAAPVGAPLRLVVFSAAQYVREFLEEPLRSSGVCSEIKVRAARARAAARTRLPATRPTAAFPPPGQMIEPRLTRDTAPLAKGYDAVCCFVNDELDKEVRARADSGWAACRPAHTGLAPHHHHRPLSQVIDTLATGGVRFVVMRCAGFDKVDLAECKAKRIKVVRVPSYSPRSIAEHALALMFALARCALGLRSACLHACKPTAAARLPARHATRPATLALPRSETCKTWWRACARATTPSAAWWALSCRARPMASWAPARLASR